MALFGLFKKEEKEILDKGLVKTRESFFGKLTRAVAGKSTIDDALLDKLEEVLISSDVGVDTTLRIIDRISKRVARDKYVDSAELNNILKEEIAGLLEENLSTSASASILSLYLHFSAAFKTIRNTGCRRQRRGKNHHDRQACI